MMGRLGIATSGACPYSVLKKISFKQRRAVASLSMSLDLSRPKCTNIVSMLPGGKASISWSESSLLRVTLDTLITLQFLSKRCDPCQRIQSAPIRFREFFVAENVCFTERILPEIMKIDKKPALQFVVEATRFSAMKFVPNIFTKTIWSTILICWSMIYSGLWSGMLVDDGSYFGNTLLAICLLQISKLRVLVWVILKPKA